MSYAEDQAKRKATDAARNALNQIIIGIHVNSEPDLRLLEGFIQTVINVGGGEILNAPMVARKFPDGREIVAGEVPLDYYLKRADQLGAAVDAERDVEASGDGESLNGCRLDYCHQLIKFLRERGAKPSKELPRQAALV